MSCRRQEIKQASEHEKESLKDFKSAVGALGAKVRAARQAAARSASSAGSQGGGQRAAKRAKQGKAKPVSLTVPKSGISAELLQSLAPEGCHFAESAFKKAWRSWWTGSSAHLGNRQRSWGCHGHAEAGRELLREVWGQWTSDTGEPCPLKWE